MPKPFAGFSPSAITFLRQLKKNNAREWFTPRKEEFESLLKQPMLELTAVRRAIAEDGAGFKKQIDAKACVKRMGPCRGESLTRDPKGYEGHPAAALLRRKQFFYFVEEKSSLVTQPGLEKRIIRSFKAMAPVIEFLNQVFLANGAGEEEEPRPKRPVPVF